MGDDTSKRKYSRPGFKFETGFRIELLETGVWYTCKILQVDWGKELILIHYDRWSHKFDEWVPMSSPDIRPCKDKGRQRQDSKKHFRVREDVFAVWSDGRRYPGSVQAVLPNDTYQVMFFDGFVKKLKSRQMSKWTRENEQRFGTAEYAGGPGASGLPALPVGPGVPAAAAAGAAPGAAGPSAVPPKAGAPFVPQVLDTKRKRKTNPIVEELLGPKRARRQQREESESRHRSPSGAPSTGSAASTPGGSGGGGGGRSSRKQSWAISSREDADADSAGTGSEWDSMPEEEEDFDGVEDTGGEEEDVEEEEDSAEEESVYSESAVSLDDTASSSYRSISPSAPTPSPAAASTPAASTSASGVDPLAQQDLPAGWRRVLTPRAQRGRLDITVYSAEGMRFRSRAELERWMQRTGTTHLDPAIIFRRPARGQRDGQIGRPPSSRRQSSASSPPRGVGRPSFSTGSLSQPAGSSESGAGGSGRPSFTSTPSYPGPGTPAGARGVYVGPALPKKLPLGWALEPIVDKPVEPEQQDFSCVDRDCNKKFRKESLLQMHIKHYHPHLRHLINARSANVARQAESRTMQSLMAASETTPAAVESPGRTLARLRSVGEAITAAAGAGGGRERRRGSSGDRAWMQEHVPSPPPPPPPPPPPVVAESPRTAVVMPPTDDPKLLAEPVVSVRSDVPRQLALHARSAAEDRHARGFRRPRRRHPTTDESPGAGGGGGGGGELSDFIQIVDHESPQKTGSTRRSLSRPQRRMTGDGDGGERGDGGRLQSYASLDDVGSPGSPAPSSVSARDVDAGGDDDVTSEPGVERLEHHEVIRCSCGVQEEEGLMIQCELCLSWQHGVCLGIASDAEVPSRYVCATCRHPWRVRHTQRYVWEQQLFRDGALLRLPFGGEQAALERAQAVMRAACDLTANALSLQAVIRSLRTKLAIAGDINHPKLYLWARPWSPPPEPGDGQPGTATVGEGQSQPVAETGNQSGTVSVVVDDQSALAPGVEDQSHPADASADQSASLLAEALESPALLAAAAELTASHVTSPAELVPGHVTSDSGQNGPAGEPDPLASLSSDQTALLAASLAAASGADGTPSDPNPAPTDDTTPPLPSTDSDPPPATDDTATTTAAEGEGAGEGAESLEETDDPLSGVLDAIVGLLPSQSDLDQLMDGPVTDGPVTEPTPAPPAAPVSEARIDPATCQVNLLQHVTQMQMALMARLDTVEQHVEALEKVAELEPEWDGQRPEVCRALLHSVLRDVQLMERLGRLS